MTHFGLWRGAALAIHGQSRSHQYSIETETGGHVWTIERHDLPVGTQVRFRYGYDLLGIEALAIDIVPVDLVDDDLAEPVAPIGPVEALAAVADKIGTKAPSKRK